MLCVWVVLHMESLSSPIPGLYILGSRSPCHPKFCPPKCVQILLKLPRGKTACSKVTYPTTCSSWIPIPASSLGVCVDCACTSSGELSWSWQSPLSFLPLSWKLLPGHRHGPLRIPCHSIQKSFTRLKTSLVTLKILFSSKLPQCFYGIIRTRHSRWWAVWCNFQCPEHYIVLKMLPHLVLWCPSSIISTSGSGKSQTGNEAGKFLGKWTHLALLIIIPVCMENRKISKNSYATWACIHTRTRWGYHRYLELNGLFLPSLFTWPLSQPDTILHHSGDNLQPHPYTTHHDHHHLHGCLQNSFWILQDSFWAVVIPNPAPANAGLFYIIIFYKFN